jgi:hypothetical protein
LSPGAADRRRPWRRRVLGTLAAVAVAFGALVAEELGMGDELWSRLPGDGLRGLVVSVDDTGLSDSPSEGGWIAVVPGDRLGRLLARAGLDGEGAVSHLAYEGFAVDDAAVADLGATLVPVGYRGRFTLHATGAQVLCRVHAYAGARYVRGCQVLTLPSDGRIRASVGEAGFRVGVR